MAKSYDPVFSARVPHELRARVQVFAKLNDVPPSVVARAAFHLYLTGECESCALALRSDAPTTGDKDADLALIREALHLAPDADNAAIIKALQALIATTVAEDPNDPAHSAPATRGKSLPPDIAALPPERQAAYAEAVRERAAHRERLKKIRERERARGKQSRKSPQ